MKKATKYVSIYMPKHPKSSCTGSMLEHRLVAEKVLGKYLPEGSVIHHIDGNGLNNKNNNLVICQDSAYHNLLHARERRLRKPKITIGNCETYLG